MSDKLITSNGETVSIDLMIEALDKAPDKAEVMQALKALRQEKVKDALNETVRAAKFDLSTVLDEFMHDGEKSAHTVVTYRREIGRLLQWIEREGLNVLQLRRADVNRFKGHLAGRYSANTVRLTLAACSSLYTYLEAERYIQRTPFLHVKYPRRVFKKAVQVDQQHTCPVMNQEEYWTLLQAIEKRATAAGDHVSDVNRRKSAKQLLRAVRIMGELGLRVGDLLTVRREDGDRISYREKGGAVLTKELTPELDETLGGARYPFKGIGKSTIQGALRRVTVELAGWGAIRYPYSCHDLRHFFAVRFYEETRDIVRLQRELGHATVNTTQIYLAGLGAE